MKIPSSVLNNSALFGPTPFKYSIELFRKSVGIFSFFLRSDKDKIKTPHPRARSFQSLMLNFLINPKFGFKIANRIFNAVGFKKGIYSKRIITYVAVVNIIFLNNSTAEFPHQKKLIVG